MNRLQLIIAYLCQMYPHRSELSKSRLTKLVYLADWYSSLVDDQELTGIEWHFNHYGPYVEDVIDEVMSSPFFSLEHQLTIYGTDKFLVKFNGRIDPGQINPRVKQILDAVIHDTQKLYYNDFIDFVYSTYPVKRSSRYEDLDLVSLAREYKHNHAS
ncbi:Panacea domain-containing protein [Vibrio cincinnatiensis]